MIDNTSAVIQKQILVSEESVLSVRMRFIRKRDVFQKKAITKTDAGLPASFFALHSVNTCRNINWILCGTDEPQRKR